MNEILKIAHEDQKKAWEVIEETKVVEIWSSVGATINLVGSLRMGLLIQRRDVDFHIYTNPFKLSDSFRAISRLAENRRIKSVTYANLLETEERCVEWHASYEKADGNLWQIDMIHILADSPYAGYFEKVADRISAVLTEEHRVAILNIKRSIPPEKHVMGIEIYRAVLEGGIGDLDSFWTWRGKNPPNGIVRWVP